MGEFDPVALYHTSLWQQWLPFLGLVVGWTLAWRMVDKVQLEPLDTLQTYLHMAA